MNIATFRRMYWFKFTIQISGVIRKSVVII